MLTLEERIARLEKQTNVVSLRADSALSDIPDEVRREPCLPPRLLPYLGPYCFDRFVAQVISPGNCGYASDALCSLADQPRHSIVVSTWSCQTPTCHTDYHGYALPHCHTACGASPPNVNAS